ncbi:hypothetical protein QX776_07190 [Alteromonadaceae bacterium BrNp21-10]|nr:hypothetical protein [Alteromonadaceae bacterium BrNp21-10]
MSKDFRVRKDDRLDWEESQTNRHAGNKHAGHDRRAPQRAKIEQLAMRKRKVLQQSNELIF